MSRPGFLSKKGGPLRNCFLLISIVVGTAAAQAAEMEPRLLYCQGELPGYGYRLRVVDSTTIETLSVTSIGRFTLDPKLPKQGNMLSLRGTLVGIQHRWREERVIRISENLLSPDESLDRRVLEISGIPFYCVDRMPPDFQ